MSQIKMDSEDIAEIRNVLEIIEDASRRGDPNDPNEIEEQMEIIRKSGKRIDKLLPVVKFEGVK